MTSISETLLLYSIYENQSFNHSLFFTVKMNRLVILILAVASVSCNLLSPLSGRSALGGVGGLFGIDNNYDDSELSVNEKKENNMVRRVVTTHTEVYESDDEGQKGAGFRGGLSGLGVSEKLSFFFNYISDYHVCFILPILCTM